MIEQNILSGVLYNEEYARSVLPFLSLNYFRDDGQRIVLGLIQNYIEKYNKTPSVEALAIDLTNKDGLSQKAFESAKDALSAVAKPEVDMEWLKDQTEQFCKDRAIYNAIRDSMSILEDKDGTQARGNIPKLLQDALGVSFDTSVGHDYLDDFEHRFDFYHRREERIPFDLEYMNKITKGGLPRKTLNIILAGTGVGKSLAMCHFAATNLMHGKNVLYITLEMAEEKIAQRIDANLLDVTVDELEELPRDAFEKKIERVRAKTMGRLVVKEFPTSAAHAGHFRHLLNELRIKKKFVPDVIYIDYLNICASSRMKMGASVNSYTYIKSIAEEFRGLAVEFNVPVVSATQTTRGGYDNSDVGLTDTSESFGLPATADIMFALVATEELNALGQLMVKQLKNRYGDLSHNTRFTVGVDRSKFRLYDVEQSAQEDLMNDTSYQTSRKMPDKPLNSFGERERRSEGQMRSEKPKRARGFDMT